MVAEIQIGQCFTNCCASTVEGLKELFLSAQTSESLIICLSDRANIKLFQGTCENMAKLLNAPANSEHHEMFLQGLKANLDQAFYKIHSVHPATDAILEPGIALKLANELRGPKPKLSVYPLHKMRTELDTMNGTQKDDGSIVFEDGKLKKKENNHVNMVASMM